jgi:predicted nucleic acid-binding protein
MMPVIVDANIFLRKVDAGSPHNPILELALDHLRAGGYLFYSFEQTSYEFWTVATRPIANNGLGMTPALADRELDNLLKFFPLLDDLPGKYKEWRSLVRTYAVSGKPAHDARYVAGMATYGIAHILTFNVSDFARFPGITPLDPAALAIPSP